MERFEPGRTRTASHFSSKTLKHIKVPYKLFPISETKKCGKHLKWFRIVDHALHTKFETCATTVERKERVMEKRHLG